MTTNATGPPTSFASLPTLNPDADSPNGLGINEIILAIDEFLAGLDVDPDNLPDNIAYKDVVNAFTAISTMPTPGAADDSTKIANTAWVRDRLAESGIGDPVELPDLPFIDVKEDYDAVGDGSADDTTAIQNALNGAGAGSVVVFPPGAYKITSTITVPVGVNMMGWGVSRQNSTSTGARIVGTASPMFQWTASFPGQQKIENLKFIPTTASNTIFRWLPASVMVGLIIENCGFVGTGKAIYSSSPIAGGGAERITIRDCFFSGFTNAIYADRVSNTTLNAHWDKNVIEGCLFENCGGGSQIYVNATYLRSGAIRDCVFHGASNSRGSIEIRSQAVNLRFANIFTEDMCRAAAGVYDDIFVGKSIGSGAGEPLRPAQLIFDGCHLCTGAATPRYGINLNELGGVGLNNVLIAGALVQGVWILNGTLKYAGETGQWVPHSNSVDIHCSQLNTTN